MTRAASTRAHPRRVRRSVLAACALFVLLVGATAVTEASRPADAGAVVIDPLPLPTLPPDTTPTLPPDTTPTTTPPDTTPTTTPPDTTPTTSPPDTTPTTSPPTTTPSTRPGPTTTTTTRPKKSAGAPPTSGTASGSGGSFVGSTPSGTAPARRARAAARRAAAGLAALPPGTVAPTFPPVQGLPEVGGPSVLGATRSRRPVAPVPEAFTRSASGTNRVAWAIGFGVLLAAATALGLALRERDARGRRASRLGALVGQPLIVDRNDGESDLRRRLDAAVAHGQVNVSGSDARSMQLLVKVAAYRGLEIRDPQGFIGAATERLVDAYGSVPDRKRIGLRWAVIVSTPTVEVPQDQPYVVQHTGPAGEGRRLSFAPGASVLLWDGELL